MSDTAQKKRRRARVTTVSYDGPTPTYLRRGPVQNIGDAFRTAMSYTGPKPASRIPKLGRTQFETEYAATWRRERESRAVDPLRYNNWRYEKAKKAADAELERMAAGWSTPKDQNPYYVALHAMSEFRQGNTDEKAFRADVARADSMLAEGAREMRFAPSADPDGSDPAPGAWLGQVHKKELATEARFPHPADVKPTAQPTDPLLRRSMGSYGGQDFTWNGSRWVAADSTASQQYVDGQHGEEAPVKKKETRGAIGGGQTQLRDANGDAVQLTSEEQARYDALAASGKYTDEDTMRLRAMRESRGDDVVRQMAWDLRARRDEALARTLAAEDSTTDWQQYFTDAHTTPELLSAVMQKGPVDEGGAPLGQTGTFYFEDGDAAMSGAYARSGREWLLKKMQEEKSGTEGVDWGMRARHKFLARRFNLDFKDETKPGPWTRVPVRYDKDGWTPTANPRFKTRMVTRTDAPDLAPSFEAAAGGAPFVPARGAASGRQYLDTRLPKGTIHDPAVLADIPKYADAILAWDANGGSSVYGAKGEPSGDAVPGDVAYMALVRGRNVPTGRYELAMPVNRTGVGRHKKVPANARRKIDRAVEVLRRRGALPTQGALVGGKTLWSSGPRTTNVGTSSNVGGVQSSGRYFAAYPGSGGMVGTSSMHSQAQANWLARNSPYVGDAVTGSNWKDAWGGMFNYQHQSLVNRTPGGRAPDPAYAAALDRWYDAMRSPRDNPFRSSSLNVRDWTGTSINPDGSFVLDGMSRTQRAAARRSSGQDSWSPFGRYS